MVFDILEELGVSENDLSNAALSFVRSSQKKKDELTARLAEDKSAIYYKLTKNGVLRSSVLEEAYEKLQSTYDASVESIVDNLRFQINFLGDGATVGGEPAEYAYPYNPDYSLDYAGRYYAVYNYYMSMTDAKVRYALFQADTLACDYLGDFYATLYDRLRIYAEEE